VHARVLLSSRTKLAVILHVDVGSSTGFIQFNETLAHDRMQDAFRQLLQTVSDHEGTTHEIRGDALGAEFTHASDAVSTALPFKLENKSTIGQLDHEIRPTVRAGSACAIGEEATPSWILTDSRMPNVSPHTCTQKPSKVREIAARALRGLPPK